MNRISSNMSNNDLQHYLRGQEVRMNKIMNQSSSQERLGDLRDDPTSAAHSIRFRSRLTRNEQFAENTAVTNDRLRESEGHIESASEIIQKIRELAVQGANGTYTKDDLGAIAVEVNQYLEQLVQIGNTVSGDGSFMFSGTKSTSMAFKAINGPVAGSGESMITKVEYKGSMDPQKVEIAEQQFMETNMAGNSVFWAENQQVFASRDAGDYLVPQDSTIRIDGREIELKAGDNIDAIVYKINGSGGAVKASVDPIRNGLVIETTTPHQLWMENGIGTAVLEDLGVLASDGSRPPENYADDARVSGGSLFDSVINLRDSLFKGDQESIGSRDLKGIDMAFQNILNARSEIGAKNMRLESNGTRLDTESYNITRNLSRENDVDAMEVAMQLKQIEVVHKASLATAAKVMQPTLLDFLR